jgi:hypothetical protein
VVLVDFWEYTCINWIRTAPYVKAWNRDYAALGLVVIGVHAPEFEFGKRAENIDRGIRDHAEARETSEAENGLEALVYEHLSDTVGFFVLVDAVSSVLSRTKLERPSFPRSTRLALGTTHCVGRFLDVAGTVARGHSHEPTVAAWAGTPLGAPGSVHRVLDGVRGDSGRAV